jgi:hypothetical protein
MATEKKKGMTKAEMLKDAELEVNLPSKYNNPKPGSTERPIPRTAKRNFIRDYVMEGDGPVPKKYVDYAEQEAKEAADEERRETRGMKKGGVVKSSASKRADGCAKRGKTKGRMV